MLQAYKNYWKNYAKFSGVTSRAGYWWVVLANTIIYTILVVFALFWGSDLLHSIISGNINNTINKFSSYIFLFLVLTIIIYAISTIIPNFSLLFRRIRDTGLSAWWFILLPLSFLCAAISQIDDFKWLSVIQCIIEIIIFVIKLLPTKAFNKQE